MSAFNLPNLLSITRALLAPVAFWVILEGHWLYASIILLVALVTDLADGKLARHWSQTSALGGFLDHASDAILVTCVLAALAILDIVTPVLPVLVAAAFTQYTLDSKALHGQPLRASKLGRYNGVLYFIVSGFPIMQPVAGLVLLTPQYVMWFSWLLVATTSLSMVDRGYALLAKN